MELGLNLFIGEDVFKYCFNFEVSQNHAISLEKVLQENPLLGSFFQIFGNTGLFDKQTLEANPTYVVWTKERKIDLEKYVENYKAYFPKLNELKKIFEQLKENECICVLPSGVPINTCTRLTIWEELDKRNKTKSRGMEEFFSPIAENYDLFCFVGNERKKIGQTEKTKRVCRWCHNKMGTVTFKQKAHAISEALGNKNLILLDECDGCNHRFANTIERDVINYFRPANALYGVKGKRGRTKIKTPTTEITTIDDHAIYAATHQKIVEDGQVQAPLQLGQVKIIGQNIYKAFCKFALSLVDDETLKSFDWTIDWINGSNKVSKVPIVKVLASDKYSCKNVAMRLHVRKNNRDDLPKLFGIFYHTSLVHLFIVPKDKEELDKFVNEENFENFFKALPYWCEMWRDLDLSSDVEQSFKAEMGFKQKEQGE